jgi:hypothetical protein
VARGALRHKDDPSRLVSLDQIDAVLGDLRRLTEGGIQGAGGGG